jgi:ABC-type transporter Mla subunit MlaD
MRLSDKTIGYAVFAALVLLAGGIALQMWNVQRHARDKAYVLFQELGSLQTEDPVTIRGFRVGKVSSVNWGKDGALVTIALDAPRIFRAGTLFRNENFSLMGQRRLAIEPSKSGDITAPDHIFVGEFEPGIAEAMHLMEMVKDQVLLVRDLAVLLQHGDSMQPSLPQIVETLLDEGENVTEKLHSTVRTAQPQISATLDQVNKLSHQAIVVTRQTDSTVEHLTGTLTLRMDEAHQFIKNIHSTLDRLDQILVQIEQHPLTGDLLYKRELVNQVESLVVTLQAVLKKVDRQGIVILDEKGERKSMVKLRNINLFGETAREKAAP